MKVYAAVYSHRHGEDVRVFATADGARHWRACIADEWWEHEMPPGRAKPESLEEIAEEYWDRQMSHGEEWFVWEECELEGATS